MKGKPSPPLPSANKQQPQTKKMIPLYVKCYNRSAIFHEQQLLGWDIIDMESCLYLETNVTIESITMLTSLYMKIIEKLNTLQDPRENYFSLKMQKLMAEPYVIRCFNNNTQEKDNKKSALQSRRKELQQRLEKEVERHNHRKVLEQVIIAHEEKQKKMKDKVKEIVEQSNRKLEERIKRRNQIKQMRNSMLSASHIVASEGYIPIDYPKFASNPNRPNHNHHHTQIQSSSSFQLQQGEGDYFNILKRQIHEQEQQEKWQHRMRCQANEQSRPN